MNQKSSTITAHNELQHLHICQELTLNKLLSLHGDASLWLLDEGREGTQCIDVREFPVTVPETTVC